jgi:hypothetical protein
MLYYNTINELLKNTLQIVMKAAIFNHFRLVGGTVLSLQIGHRVSIDIDLFSDQTYGTINFNEIDEFLNQNFNYVSSNKLPPALGKSFIIGKDQENAIKLDIYYTDSFIFPCLEIDDIRMASVEEIIAMKIDVIQRGGRKKDFWDLNELLPKYSIHQMLEFHEKRYPYTHDKKVIIRNLTHFEHADDDLNPICMKGKYWEFIKEDFQEMVSKLGM